MKTKLKQKTNSITYQTTKKFKKLSNILILTINTPQKIKN